MGQAHTGSYKIVGDIVSFDSVSGRWVTYSHNEDINLNLEQKVFSFPDGRKFALNMSEGEVE